MVLSVSPHTAEHESEGMKGRDEGIVNARGIAHRCASKCPPRYWLPFLRQHSAFSLSLTLSPTILATVRHKALHRGFLTDPTVPAG